MKRKNIIIGIIIAVIIIAITSYSYAYFLAHIDNSSAKENTFKAGKMEVTFTDGPEIKMDNANLGQTIKKEFTVKNTGNFDTTYNLKLDSVINTFKDKTDLRYTLKRNEEDLVKELSVPKGNNYIATELPISVGGIDTYEITIEFKETKTNQNDNQGASFSGKIQVDSEENVTLLTNPEVTLYQGMIPVDYDGKGNVVVADTENDLWYDYTVSEWANAVLVNSNVYDKYNNKPNTIIPMEDILQMYVYIPRYKYQLWNVNNEGVPKQIINIQFENELENTGDIKCIYTNNNNGTITEDCKNKDTNGPARNGEWYTHPAFTFKGTIETSGTELPGIWVGKFEPSDPTDLTGRGSSINEITILPNKTSLVSRSSDDYFSAIRSMETNEKYNLLESEIDAHPMKNIDWGAVTYLSQSVYGIYKDEKTCGIDGMSFDGCKVWHNNTTQSTGDSGGVATGCVADSIEDGREYNTEYAPAKCADGRRWNQDGIKASTTGNIYGIYDMSTLITERMMATVVDSTGNFTSTGTGCIPIDTPAKYYDLYAYDTRETTIERSYLGDAIREVNTGKQIAFNGNWITLPYENNESPTALRLWVLRGGTMYNHSSGIFTAGRHYAYGNWGIGFRVVLTAQ